MSEKEFTLSEQQARLGREASQWVTRYTQMNLEMAQSAMRSATPLMNAWANWYQSIWTTPLNDMYKAFNSTLGSSSNLSGAQPCCDIPDTECPPRCACTIQWQAAEGERRAATIRIRNSSKDTITYQISAKPFQTCGKAIDASPTVTPQSISAAPGEIVTVAVQADVTAQFHGGASYCSEILIAGKYERCVRIELQVTCGSETSCCFDLGDIPYRKRADAWYHHFQCSEPCFEPVTTRSNPAGQ